MTIDEKGVVKWVNRRNLYSDDLFCKFKACIKAWAATGILLFLLIFTILLMEEKFRFSLKLFALPGALGGGAFVALTLFTLPGLYFLAWANGGVEEWEYEAELFHVKGRKIVHHPGRMKLLRFFVGLAMIMATKPGQTAAMRSLLRDTEKTEFDIWFFDASKVKGIEETHTIEIESKGETTEVRVSPEDYAEMLAFFKPKPKPKPRRRRTKKSDAASSVSK